MAHPGCKAPRGNHCRGRRLRCAADREGVSRGTDPSNAQVHFERLIDGHPGSLDPLRPAAALGFGAVSVVLLIACFNVAGVAPRALRRAAGRVRRQSGSGGESGSPHPAAPDRGPRPLRPRRRLRAVARALERILLSTFSVCPRRSRRACISPPTRGWWRSPSRCRWWLRSFRPSHRRVNSGKPISRALCGAALGLGGRPLAVRARRVGSCWFRWRAPRSSSSPRSSSAEPSSPAGRGYGLQHREHRGHDCRPRHCGHDAVRAQELVESLDQPPRTSARCRLCGFRRPGPLLRRLSEHHAHGPGRTGSCEASACPMAELFSVDPRYFATMSVPVRLGRWFDPRDAWRTVTRCSSPWPRPPAWWPELIPSASTSAKATPARERVVVGVVTDTSVRSLSGRARSNRQSSSRSPQPTFEEPVTIVAAGAARPRTSPRSHAAEPARHRPRPAP